MKAGRKSRYVRNGSTSTSMFRFLPPREDGARTRDLGGQAATKDFAAAIVRRLDR
jgi:hypothetical protein